MLAAWIDKSAIRRGIYIPQYYDPGIRGEIAALQASHYSVTIGQLVRDGFIKYATGHEIGSESYGTGNIPFVRTSDISNWEIKSAPKQGVSEAVYAEYAVRQDVRVHDILLVRDGTYLIGTTCFVTSLDTKILYQSHILKIRVIDKSPISAHTLFIALNTDIVQRQIRSVQFTADIIDTIGDRFLELELPIPRDDGVISRAAAELDAQLAERVRGKCFIRQAPILLEDALRTGSTSGMETFLAADLDAIASSLVQDTVSLEFGGFEATWLRRSSLRSGIYLPKYYDPEIDEELSALSKTCELRSISSLQKDSLLALSTGDEPGKMAYGTGDIPFLRTSDFANWEIKHNPKQGLSEEIYETYRESQDVGSDDIFLVRDGTYLVGSTTIVSGGDAKLVYCGGLYKIRALHPSRLDPYLVLGLLNSYIVKRQLRSKQFTRDVIDTLGKRLNDVQLPIPKSPALRERIASVVRDVVHTRLAARDSIKSLVRAFAHN